MSKYLNLFSGSLPSLDDQKKSVKNIESTVELATAHAITMFLADPNLAQCNETIYSDNYVPPTGDQVKAVVVIIMSRGYTKGKIARLLDVTDLKNRTILRWEKSGEEASSIPYAAWRLLCAYAGVGIDLMLPEISD